MTAKGSRNRVRLWLARVAIGGVLTLAGSAMAADMAVKAPPPAPAAYDWTGFYVGSHLGYAWGNSDFSSRDGISGTLNPAQQINQFDEAGSWFLGVRCTDRVSRIPQR